VGEEEEEELEVVQKAYLPALRGIVKEQAMATFFSRTRKARSLSNIQPWLVMRLI